VKKFYLELDGAFRGEDRKLNRIKKMGLKAPYIRAPLSGLGYMILNALEKLGKSEINNHSN
jgi:hypothetical protein